MGSKIIFHEEEEEIVDLKSYLELLNVETKVKDSPTTREQEDEDIKDQDEKIEEGEQEEQRESPQAEEPPSETPVQPEAKEAYRMVLETVWVDGVLDPGEVNLLARKREDLGISFEEHLTIVRDMLG